MKRLITILLAAMLPSASAFAQLSFGTASLFNDGWEFRLEEGKWREVSLPHDWSIEGQLSPTLASCTGYLPAGKGEYRKTFDGRELPDAEEYYIYFEGIYNRSKVYLNGHLLGERPNGYISFAYELTPYLERNGENLLTVEVDHSRLADSRWYTGSGIYRDCYLVTAGSVHFAQWGVGYRSEDIDAKSATVVVDADIEGLSGAENYTLSVSLLDADGKTVATAKNKARSGQSLKLKLRNPHLWSIEDPYLYTLRAEIYQGSKVVDAMQTEAGIRSLEFDPDKGFALNGNWMKVKGVCLHHDAGVLGAAVPEEVLETRLLALKKLGVNAVRTSHNPQAPVFYELCDRLGLLVMDEAFDEWEFPKRKWVEGWNVGTPAYDGTYDFFYEWAETDVRDMVRRDRNHPSIFLWSIGNEVDYPNDPYSHPVLDGGNADFTQPAFGGYKPDAPDAMRIGEIARKLAACVREEDSSRPVTGALAGVVMSNQTAYPEVIDVVGYNYTESRYAIDHETYPDRIIYGSENSPTYEAWTAVRDNPFIFGQFIWTGTDYLGESNAWPSRGFYSGLLDLTNYPKPRGRFREALWSDAPVCYLGTSPRLRDTTDAWDDWNYEPGQQVRVFCYTNGAAAELLLDGKTIGERKPYNMETGLISWDVGYAPGELCARVYDESGNLFASDTIKTVSRPFSLTLEVDKPCLEGRGKVAQVVIEVLDDDGNRCTLADNMITCLIEGPGELLGLESGNNTDMSDYTDASHRAFRGRLVAYIRSTSDSGTIKLKFTSPLLQGAQAEINIL